MDLTPEQRLQGKRNFEQASGLSRRDFLKAAVAAPAAGAAFLGFQGLARPDEPVRAGLIGAGDEGGILLTESNPDFIKFVAYSDIRPSNRERIMKGEGNNARIGFEGWMRRGQAADYPFQQRYTEQDLADIESKSSDYHDDYTRMLEDDEIEAVVVALPLHLHAPAAIAAMDAGKHVLCEKLMGWSVREAKMMARKAAERGVILSIGHQRHYSLLYAAALDQIRHGTIGEIRHIRALWHRNQTWPTIYKNKPLLEVHLQGGTIVIGIVVQESGESIRIEDRTGQQTDVPKAAITRLTASLRDSWNKPIPPEDAAALTQEELRRHGYESIEQLVRWRLYNSTGGGLMAELGSHQLDACSIFLGKVHPIAVSGVGTKSFFREDRTVHDPIYGDYPLDDPREVDDHVFCTFEYPGPTYWAEDGSVANPGDIVVVTYSSINTNTQESYGEHVMGTRGTLIVENEQEVMLFAERDPNTGANQRGARVVVQQAAAGAPAVTATETMGVGGGEAVSIAGEGRISRGYREEMEHFAYCIRNAIIDDLRSPPPPEGYRGVRCNGRVALADAVVALTSNLAMRRRKRVVFKPEYFDPFDDLCPEDDPDVVGDGPSQAQRAEVAGDGREADAQEPGQAGPEPSENGSAPPSEAGGEAEPAADQAAATAD